MVPPAFPQPVHTSSAELATYDPLEGPTPVASPIATRPSSPFSPHKLLVPETAFDKLEGSTSPYATSPFSPAKLFLSRTAFDPLEGDTPVATPTATRPSSPVPSEKTLAGKELEAAKKPVPASDQPSEFNRDSILTLVGTTLIMFTMFGFSNSAGVFQSYYSETKLSHIKPGTIAWIGSTHLALCFSSGLVSGPLFDRGWYRVQLAAGSIGWLAGLFLLSISNSFGAVLATQGILLGLSLGTLFSPTLAILGLYFRQNRATCLGVCAAGGGIGSILYPLVLNRVLPKLGFGMTVRIVAFVSIPLLLLSNVMIRPRTPVVQPVRQSFGKVAGRALGEKQTWAVCIGVAGGMMALFTSIFYTEVFFKRENLPSSLSNNCLAILQAFAVIGRLSGGRLADRFGVWRVIVPACAMTGASVFLLLACSKVAAAIIFLVIFGLSSGVLLSVAPSAFMRLSHNQSEMGLRSGLGFCFVAVAALISSPISGSLLVAAHEKFIAPCAFAGSLGIIGSSLIVLGSKWLETSRKQSASAFTA